MEFEWTFGEWHQFYEEYHHEEIEGLFAIFRGSFFKVPSQDWYYVFDIREGGLNTPNAKLLEGKAFGTVETAKAAVEEMIQEALDRASEAAGEIDWRPTDTLPEDYYSM